MKFTARQIAELLNGTIEGDPEVSVNALSKIEEGQPNTLSFLANPKYVDYIYQTLASIVIVSRDFEPEKPLKPELTLIRVDNPYESFAKLLSIYNEMRFDKKGVDPNAVIEDSAQIGNDCYIGPGAQVAKNSRIGDNVKIYSNTTIGENVSIGNNSIIHQGVNIYHDSEIGENCIIHSGVVLGCDGFGFAPNSENNYNKVAQIGNVIIENHVEIGANTTIDRATLGSTIIRKGVKLDNLIQIAHNVEIGENTVIAAQTGIAGSTKIGKNCMIGGQVGIVGHLNIGDEVKIAAQSGISSDLNKGDIVQGSPAFGIGEYKRSYVGFRKLPDLMGRIAELEKELKQLKKSENKNGR